MAEMNNYFSFSKRERAGVVILIFLIIIIFILPEIFPVSKNSIDAADVAEMKEEIAALEMYDTSSHYKNSPGYGKRRDSSSYAVKDDQNDIPLFYFDPNSLSIEGWEKLGLSARTSQTITKYISKGGRFRKPEDLRKIYGLTESHYRRLLPFARIQSLGEPIRDKVVYRNTIESIKIKKPGLSIRDINETDTSMLIELPGIGSKLANRIINFRDKLGGFYSIDQIKEIYGLPDSTYQRIKPFIQCNGSVFRKINLNTADITMLKDHPYIKWNMATAIISYRQQHGSYKSSEELLNIDIISPQIFQKIMPYLTIN